MQGCNLSACQGSKKEKTRIAAVIGCFSLLGETKAINPRVWDRVPRF